MRTHRLGSILRGASLFSVLVLTGGALGCDAAETAFDCVAACQFWEECIDSELDVDGCATDCGQRSAGESGFSDALDACDACISDNVGVDCENADSCRSACEDVVSGPS